MKWFRLWDEVLDDPKVQKLHPGMFKQWVNLLCLASKTDPRGTLPPVEEIAFRLRLRLADAQRVVEHLCAVGLLEPRESRGYVPHKWTERQRPSDDIAARVRAHRARTIDRNPGNVTLHETLPAAVPEQGRNVTVTPLDTDRDIDSPSLRSGGASDDAPAPAAPISTPTTAPKPANRVAAFVDAVVAAGVPAPSIAARDGRALKECAKPAALLGAAYAAAWRGEWGDEWFRENLSPALVVSRIAGYEASTSGPPPAARSRRSPTAPTRTSVADVAAERLRAIYAARGVPHDDERRLPDAGRPAGLRALPGGHGAADQQLSAPRGE